MRAHEATTVPRKPFSWKFFAIAAAIAGVAILFTVAGADYDELNQRQSQLSQRFSEMLAQQQARLEQQEQRLEAQAKQLVRQENMINELRAEIRETTANADAHLPRGTLHVFFEKCPSGWEERGELELTSGKLDSMDERDSSSYEKAGTKQSNTTVLCEQ